MGRRFLRVWEVLVVGTTVALGVELPGQLSLHLQGDKAWDTVNVFIALVFLFDVFVQYRRPQQKRAVLICDLIAGIPFLILPLGDWIWLPLIQLLKLVRVQVILSRWKRRSGLNPGTLRLANFLFWMLMLSHWVTCGWIALRGEEMEGTAPERYIDGLYWCITTLSTVGYGDRTPDTSVEKIYAMFVMIVGVASYGFVIGNVASFLSNRDIERAQFLEKVDRMDSFLRYRKVPLKVRDRVKSYYQYLWDSRLGSGDQEVLDDLIDSLQTEVLLHINRGLIEKVPFFRKASTDFLRDIVHLLEPCVFLPGDFIFKEGDVGNAMFFLSSGEVEVLSAREERIAVLSEGAYFGEIALLRESHRTASIRALDYCNAYELKGEAVRDLIQRYPEFEQHLCEEALQRSRNLDSLD